MSTFLKKKLISKKSYADRPYLIFFGDVSGNKEHFYTPHALGDASV